MVLFGKSRMKERHTHRLWRQFDFVGDKSLFYDRVLAIAKNLYSCIHIYIVIFKNDVEQEMWNKRENERKPKKKSLKLQYI